MGDIKILHISDTHFGAHDEDKRSALSNFAQSWKPDIVALTGDILDSPMPWQSSYFDKAKTFIDEMRRICPVYCIPGNHDALLGSLCLERFWRKLQLGSTSFVAYPNVAGQHICLICVDTTHLSIRHLNNSGIFDKATESKLETALDRIRNQHGDELDRAITIALVHHHPIPTITAAAERILYFKNSGRFLRFAVKHNVRLILHGHQHDPHFTKLSFGSDHEEDLIGILSAGSCIKTDHSEDEFSGCGHCYTVRINRERALVTSYFYHRRPGSFVQLNEFVVSRIATSQPRLVTSDQSFTVTKKGHMEAQDTRTYERIDDNGDIVVLSIGVDDLSKEASINELGLTVKVEGTQREIEVVVDEPRAKRFRVPVGKGEKGERFEIIVTYTWEGGFQSFLTSHTDGGGFTIIHKRVEWCRVTLKLEDASLALDPLEVYYAERSQIEQRADSSKQRSFTIHKPRVGAHISWVAKLKTAPPSLAPTYGR